MKAKIIFIGEKERIKIISVIKLFDLNLPNYH